MIDRRTSFRLAICWLVLVVLAAGYLGIAALRGIPLRTDLLSLLPADPAVRGQHHISQQLTDAVSRQFVLLVGHPDRNAARTAAQVLEDALREDGITSINTTEPAALHALGSFYLPYADRLLAPGDRDLLLAGQGETIARRALAQIYGVGSFADARLLSVDPFLLLPSFLSQLPAPLSKLAPDEGRLTTRADGIVWGLVSGEVAGDPYALDVQ